MKRRISACKSKIFRRGLAVVIVIIASSVSGCASLEKLDEKKEGFFTFVVLPDTQKYTRQFPETFIAQTEWLRDHAEMLNIVGVAHEGDIVTDGGNEKEWKVADSAISLLDGGVPYFLSVGNHDYRGEYKAKTRDATMFRKFFPVSRFEEKSWFGGHYGDGVENAYYFIEAGGMKFMVLCLEITPRDKALDWANKIVAENPDSRTIVVTHVYMYIDDTRLDENDGWYPRNYGNDGDQMWEKFVRKHKNIFLVLSGHCLEEGLGRRVDEGDHGNPVHQILANYQSYENGGNGWLRIMQFVPSKDNILVRTYSPLLKKFKTDGKNEFSLEYDME
ncbi:metallophosphoesterase [Candidatus Hydrogenedentota bacterium]